MWLAIPVIFRIVGGAVAYILIETGVKKVLTKKGGKVVKDTVNKVRSPQPRDTTPLKTPKSKSAEQSSNSIAKTIKKNPVKTVLIGGILYNADDIKSGALDAYDNIQKIGIGIGVIAVSYFIYTKVK